MFSSRSLSRWAAENASSGAANHTTCRATRARRHTTAAPARSSWSSRWSTPPARACRRTARRTAAAAVGFGSSSDRFLSLSERRDFPRRTVDKAATSAVRSAGWRTVPVGRAAVRRRIFQRHVARVGRSTSEIARSPFDTVFARNASAPNECRSTFICTDKYCIKYVHILCKISKGVTRNWLTSV